MISKYTVMLCGMILLFPILTVSAPLTFGTVEELPPYSFIKNNKLVGIDIDIAQEIFKRWGKEITIKGFPWARLKLELEVGELDGIVALYLEESHSLARVLDTSIPMYRSKVKIFSLSNKNLKVTSLSDLNGRAVGIIRGYEYGFEEIDKSQNFRKNEVAIDKQLVGMLHLGRIDVAIIEELPFLNYARELGLKGQFKSVYTLSEWPIRMGFSNRQLGAESYKMAKEVSEIIKQMEKEGTIQKIKNRYQ